MNATEWPQWHEDFKAVSQEVMREHREEIHADALKRKKRQDEARTKDPNRPVLDDKDLVLGSLVAWIIKHGTEEQKRIAMTWVEAMHQKRGRDAAELEKDVSVP